MTRTWARRIALFWRTYNWRYLSVRVLVNAATLIIADLVVPGINFVLDTPLITIALLAVLLGLVNAVVKPIVQMLTLQLIFATYGLVVVIINSLVLILLAELAPSHFIVTGLVPAMLGGLVMGVSSIALEGLLGLSLPVVPPEQDDLRQYVQRQESRADVLAVLSRVDRVEHHGSTVQDGEDVSSAQSHDPEEAPESNTDGVRGTGQRAIHDSPKEAGR